MSVIARLKEIEALVSVPLLNVQDELDGGLTALAGLRSLLEARSDSENEGIAELVRMIEARFLRADAHLKGLAYQTFGPGGGTGLRSPTR
ncbi:MAG: hypothetical protein IOC88_12425 [Rhodobacter sp.]|jgi:hypothetical protein|nr:hypothetical protein [Rhodobacter sp.]